MRPDGKGGRGAHRPASFHFSEARRMALVESRRSTERLSDLLRESKSCGLALTPLILSLSHLTLSLLYLSQRCLSILYSITLYQFGTTSVLEKGKAPRCLPKGLGRPKAGNNL